MKKQLLTMALLLLTAVTAQATDYYVATTGSDSNNGLTAETAFATILQAQSVAHPGDKVYIQPGTYQPTTFSATAAGSDEYGSYSIVFKMNVSGTAVKPISYIGVLDGDGNRPVFDFSGVSAESRITGFLVSASYLVFKNLDITGTPQLLDCRTNNKNCQSENIRVTNGSYNTFENIACHDSKAIGFYVTQNSAGNLFVNCDAYNNYDPLSANNAAGGNCDGFGCHVNAGYANNKFIGCRAWNNSDDGFDLISCYSPVTFAYSFAYKNGYDANGTARGDGNGFKAGGYGMSSDVTEPDGGFPCHVVTNCISTNNKTNGIYTNHHMGGVDFNHNTAINNAPYNSTSSRNYSFVRRDGLTAAAATNVDGYGHTVANNLSYNSKGWHVGALDGTEGKNTVTSNSFSWNGSAWENDALDASETFVSTSTDLVTQARLTTGYLNPETTLNYGKKKVELDYGADFSSYEAAVAEARETSGAEIEEYNPTPVDHAITTTTLWTFDGIDAGTVLSGSTVYDYNHLFISGHGSDETNQATVKSETRNDIPLDGTNTVNVTRRLDFAGSYASVPSATTAANTFVRDCASFYAGVEGTLYIYASAAAVDRGIKIVIDGVEETLPNVMEGAYTPVLNTKLIPAKSNVFISSTTGGWRLYALKFVPTATEPEPESVSVFLTAGQSNTAGRCMNENLPDYIKTLGAAHDGAYQYCNWSYTNGTTRKSDKEGVFRKFWPEMESSNNPGRFAYDAIVYYWIEQALQKDFYVVKHAAGGTSIDPACTSTNDYHWSADATWLAEHASCNADGTSMLKALCDNIGASLDALTAAGKSYDVKAMIWHQGESDRSGTAPDDYHDNLQAVVQYVRNYLVTKTGDSKYANLDFICGTVPPQSKQYNKKVYDALFTLADEDSHFHVIKTEPGTFIGDDLHFDANCAERLGINMYNKMVDLGLVSGEKQTVPEANVPEETTITLDFKTWTNDMASNSTYYNLLYDGTNTITTIDGNTTLYKVTGTDGDGDFSEFAETFALATPANVQLRGSNGLIANKKTSVLSLLNLEPGDAVTITTKSGAGADVNSLQFVSTNAYKKDDATKTAVAKDAEWGNGDTYVITEGSQIDLLFGGTANSSHYIYKVVIEKGAVVIVDPTDEPTEQVTIHTIGDSTMSSYDQSIPAQKGMDGWGDFLADCLKSSWTTVYNWADRGETAKSYYNGIWTKTSSDRPEFAEPVMNKVQAGDYVIIQFGHNDSKAYSTVKYEEWLATLVDAVKAKGATPIIASSICRARFDSQGKITRLGRIDTYEDSNRILEDGAEINDYTFDYPYHAQQVAIAKGVEFIDVTSGVKEMFETYGEAKTKALFPTGEKTHTNKLGAQLIAKVAAKLLQGTALASYVDATTLELPAPEDIDVIIDNFGSEAVVTKKTLWTFNDYTAGDVIAAAVDNSGVTETDQNVVELNGLYARSWTSRAINAVASPVESVTFSDADATTVNVSIAAFTTNNQASAANIFGQNTAGRVGASGLAPTFALNVGTPGTFYCILAPTKNNSERSERIIFSGKEVVAYPVSEAYANANHLCEIKYHAENTGVIYVSAGITSNFYAMLFIPDMEAGTEEDWNYQMVKTRENGWWTYTNMSGNNQSVPDGLTAYAVTGVRSDGKVTLADMGSVIPDGEAVVVKGEASTEYALPSTTDESAYTGVNLLSANTELRYLPATENANANYYFDGSQFQKATGGETIHEKQAYLNADAAAATLDLLAPLTTTIGSLGYSSFSHAEALDFSATADLKAYVVSGMNGSGLAVLSPITAVPGETGLILKGTPDKEYHIPFAASTPAAVSNLLVATVTETPVAASTDAMHNYMFANGSKGLGFYFVKTATTSSAGKAYLCTGTVALSNESLGAQSFVFDDETTDLRSIDNSQLTIHNYYDLQGRRVVQPTRGLYIVNGRKVVIK